MGRVSVSIGISFLNAQRFLADAVRSVFAQSHGDWELLLIDDGSTDSSLDVVRHIDDPRVRVYSDRVNRGLCARLNQIATLAQGKYLARMDADDLMHPKRIERQLAFLHANPDIDLVDTATYTIDDDLTPLGIRGDCPLDALPETVLCRGLLIHPTVMGRAEWFRKNLYDPTYVRAEDRELWCRTCAATKFGRLCEPLFFYREGLAGNLRNYLQTEATVREILRVYGPPLVGSWRTRLLVLRSRLKSVAYFLGTKLGVQGRLISGRNRPLDAATAQAARGILTEIARTSVPGLCCTAPPAEVIMAAPRILHVTTVPMTLAFLSGHVQHAKRKGFEVHALSSPGESLDEFGRDMQIEVHSTVMPRRITPLGDLGALWRIVCIMRRIRPTIVDGHTPKGALLAMMAATLCRVPVRVYHVHGLPMTTATGLKQRLLRWTERTACKLSHQVICVSKSLRELAITERLCPAEKIKVIHHGAIDGIEAYGRFDPTRIPAKMAPLLRDRYRIPRDALVVGFVGRIVRDKGLVELVRVWQALREEFASLHLLIAGSFESEDPLPANVEATLRNDPRIHLAGNVTDIPSIYRTLDLLVLPTYREGFGTVLLEAAAMEVPVVATRITGCVDAVRDGETGTLVPVRDAEALTSAVRTYLRDPDLRHRHGLGGRKRVLRDFDPELIREALFQEYVRLSGLALQKQRSILYGG